VPAVLACEQRSANAGSVVDSNNANSDATKVRFMVILLVLRKAALSTSLLSQERKGE